MKSSSSLRGSGGGSGFSGAVKLAELDDFIKPATECIKPMMNAAAAGSGSATTTTVAKIDSGKVEHGTSLANLYGGGGGERPQLIKASTSSDSKAQVTLSDCLACSGCLTSAETVLLEVMTTMMIMVV